MNNNVLPQMVLKALQKTNGHISFDSVFTEKCTKELREGLGLVKRISRSGGSV